MMLLIGGLHLCLYQTPPDTERPACLSSQVLAAYERESPQNAHIIYYIFVHAISIMHTHTHMDAQPTTAGVVGGGWLVGSVARAVCETSTALHA